MKKIISFCIILFSFSFVSIAFAADEIPKVNLLFEDYEKDVKNQCDVSSKPWGQNNSLVPIPQYPKLTSKAVNAQIDRTKILDSLSKEERQRLQKELNMNRIGDFSGYKTVEVARLQYRSTMNSLFACGIVESRLSILRDLQELVNSKFPALNSEIHQKLKKEEQNLQNQKDELKCNSAGKDKTLFMQELVNSATKQYCHYRYYLTYLDSNLQQDRALVEGVEKEIGQGDGTKTPGTLMEWVNSYNQYDSDIQREIARADASLPRALKSYKEMEKAYPIHLMLTIIYDDYIRLRKNLAIYMNASSQLYFKAFDAQDANQR